MGKGHLWIAAAALLVVLCLSCGQDKGTGPDGGALFKVELEHYFSSFDAGTSQIPIASSRCTNASNDSAASGLDVSGEWIMVSVDVPQSGAYRPTLTYASRAGAIISLRLEMDDCGTSTTADFLLTQGSGIG
jgi:hypothetical protein